MEAAEYVHRPIKAYQTRLILLHGDKGNTESEILCSLYTVDILHPVVEGLNIRGGESDDDCVVPFEALSYTWGGPGAMRHVTCDGACLLVTASLFVALQCLRPSGADGRYLWIDGICINQGDNTEKAVQVRNMLAIYQKATRVISWLGYSEENLQDVLLAAAAVGHGKTITGNDSLDGKRAVLESEGDLNVSIVCKGLEDLYQRPWFGRMWVQQEIYGARKIVFQCGNRCFDWPWLLSHPGYLLHLPQWNRHFGKPQIKIHGAFRKSNVGLRNVSSQASGNPPATTANPWAELDLKMAASGVPDKIIEQRRAVRSVAIMHSRLLSSFEYFSRPHKQHPDFVDTLVLTGQLNATDPRDYIYGIVGMCEFPAKPMPISEWVKAREHEVFIPIDYNASLASIMLAVSWAVIMEGGLGVLSRFKAYVDEPSEGGEQTASPSWVIDWRLAAALFSRADFQPSHMRNLENIWLAVKTNPSEMWQDGKINILPQSPQFVLAEPPLPDFHATLRGDNMAGDATFEKLLVRGRICEKFYAKNRAVWEKKTLRDRRAWRLEIDVYPTDIVVELRAYMSRIIWLDPAPSERPASEGFWLLRPVTGSENFQLLACLHHDEHGYTQPYYHWFKSRKIERKGLRYLLVEPEEPGQTHGLDIPPSPGDRMFSIR